MAVIKHAVLTLSGAAQDPADALEDTSIIKFITFQAAAANAGVIYIGGRDGATVTSSVFGLRIEIPTTSIPDAPLVFEGVNLSLGDFRVIGTAADELMIFTIGN